MDMVTSARVIGKNRIKETIEERIRSFNITREIPGEKLVSAIPVELKCETRNSCYHL